MKNEEVHRDLDIVEGVRLWGQKDLDVHSGSATSCVALDKSLSLSEPHVLTCN